MFLKSFFDEGKSWPLLSGVVDSTHTHIRMSRALHLWYSFLFNTGHVVLRDTATVLTLDFYHVCCGPLQLRAAVNK